MTAREAIDCDFIKKILRLRRWQNTQYLKFYLLCFTLQNFTHTWIEFNIRTTIKRTPLARLGYGYHWTPKGEKASLAGEFIRFEK